LRARIASGAWNSREVLPSLEALAKTLGASVSAVRLALNQLASEQLIEHNARLRWVVRKKPDSRIRRSGIVLEVISEPLRVPLGSGFMDIQRGILEGCGRLRAPLLTIHAHALQSAQPDEFLDLPLKGVLLVGQFTKRNLRGYEKLRLPVCYIDSPVAGRSLHSSSVDNVNAARDATQRLIELGHRQIAFVRFVLYTLRDIDPDSRERQQGFLQACEEAGIRGARESVFNYMPGREAQHSLNALLRKRPRYTAALCADPSAAGRLAHEATKTGLMLPSELGIICFQARTDCLSFSGPTTDFNDLAVRATMLLDRPKLPPTHERVSSEWRERGSALQLK
jgi:DNA-binding LacI/PurR family transcriptional regulator